MDKDKIYINGTAFPFTPVHDAGLNDVDRDSYTNLLGYTIRNRVRHDVNTLDFNIPTMTGSEFHAILQLRDGAWFNCSFFDEGSWAMVTRKMYCSSPTYTKYFLHKTDPSKNIYNDVKFSFVQQ